MSTRRMWQPWHGSNEQGGYCRPSKRFSSDLDRLEPLYKLSTLLFLLFLHKLLPRDALRSVNFNFCTMPL